MWLSNSSFNDDPAMVAVLYTRSVNFMLAYLRHLHSGHTFYDSRTYHFSFFDSDKLVYVDIFRF